MKHSCPQALNLFLALISFQLLLVLVFSIAVLIQAPQPAYSLVDMDAEANLPTWFASFQLALIAISLWSYSTQRRRARSPSRNFLRLFSAGFLVLSLDETAQLHEHITGWIGLRYVDWLPRYLSDHEGVTLFCVLVLLVALRIAYRNLSALWGLSRHASLIAVAGFLTCVTGGAILETIGYKFLLDGSSPSLYRAEVAAEELLEMLGASLILYAVVSFARVETQEPAHLAAEPAWSLR
ncbi:MAG TPA: hypothetical protein VJH03_09385 [Blastocatellia bacterium]|nr:hypothetical protein [Blastocatellia bacterium]